MNLQEALKQRPGRHVAILQDTKGPEIRTGFLKDHEPLKLTRGQDLELVTDYSVRHCERDSSKIPL